MGTKAPVPRMDEHERNDICAKLEWEGGLEYLITGSNFPDVQDKHFHTLREAFVKATKELEDYLRYDDYLNECVEEEYED